MNALEEFEEKEESKTPSQQSASFKLSIAH